MARSDFDFGHGLAFGAGHGVFAALSARPSALQLGLVLEQLGHLDGCWRCLDLGAFWVLRSLEPFSSQLVFARCQRLLGIAGLVARRLAFSSPRSHGLGAGFRARRRGTGLVAARNSMA